MGLKPLSTPPHSLTLLIPHPSRCKTGGKEIDLSLGIRVDQCVFSGEKQCAKQRTEASHSFNSPTSGFCSASRRGCRLWRRRWSVIPHGDEHNGHAASSTVLSIPNLERCPASCHWGYTVWAAPTSTSTCVQVSPEKHRGRHVIYFFGCTVFTDAIGCSFFFSSWK